MQRYAQNGPTDSPSMEDGDVALLGVDEWNSPENIAPGQVQAAINCDFTSTDAGTRGGFVCYPSLSLSPLSFTWTSRTAAAANQWGAVTWGNGLYVATSANGTGNRVMTSVDGITWTSRTSAADYDWTSVVYGNGLYVAVANLSGTTDQVMTSPDGINWTLRTTPHSGCGWTSVTYGNGTFVAVGYSGVSTTRVMTSTDGVTWTSRTPSQTTAAMQGVTYGNSLFVAVANNGLVAEMVMYSADGITWSNGTAAAANQWYSIAYGNGLFAAISIDGTNRVMTSPDGLTWTSRSAAQANTWNAVTYGAGLFVAVSQDGANRVMISRDGITWATSTAAAANTWNGITYGAGVYVAVSGDGASRVETSGQSTLVYANGIYSDPNDAGSQWIMLVGPGSVGFYANGKQSRSISYGAGLTVSAQSTVVQANNSVYIFRGSAATPLVWDGSWANTFSAATGNIPNATMALYAQNRLWAISSKDTTQASDVLSFAAWNNLDNSFNLSKGDSNYLVTMYPFGDTTILVFKNRSIIALTGVDGALNDIVASEITRQVGAVGINSVVSVGPDIVYMSDRNINLITLTSTNNSLQHKTLPLSRNIDKIFKRVNWKYAYKVSMGFNDNKLYVALPLDNSTYCNSVVVYNFVTENWYGEWNFATEIDMRIQGWVVATYLGLQRMHAVTEDGRIFVTDEGPLDISGTVMAEIESSLTTRAYRMDNNNRLNRRMWADLSTWRPTFTVTGYTEGVSESTTLVTDKTFARSESWIFSDSTYTLTNSGDNYNREGRKDYAGYCSDSIQPQSGFFPEYTQDYRFPLTFRRKGRLVWYNIANTTGKLFINSIGGEAREGDRSTKTQVG